MDPAGDEGGCWKDLGVERVEDVLIGEVEEVLHRDEKRRWKEGSVEGRARAQRGRWAKGETNRWRVSYTT